MCCARSALGLKEELPALAMVLTRFWTSEQYKTKSHQEVIESAYDVPRHVVDLETSQGTPTGVLASQHEALLTLV